MYHNLLQAPSTNQNHFQRQHFPWDFLLGSSDPTHAPSLLCQAALSCHGIASCNLSAWHASLYCSLTRLSSHAVTLNEVDELKKPQSSELVWLWLSGHVQKEHSLAWRLAVARLPDWALLCVCGWSSSACMVVVPAKLFIMWSRVGREMSKPVHVLWEFHWRCCSLKPLEHMFITSTFSHTRQAIVCTKVKAMCCSVAMY